MDFETFLASTESESPPDQLSPLLKALWWDKKGDWDKAHRIAQEISTKDGSRIHAYLHRKEGDDWNAGYWYRRAGEPPFLGTLEDEWKTLTKRFL